MTDTKLRARSFADTECSEPHPRHERQKRFERLYEYALSQGNSQKGARLFAETRLDIGLDLQADELIREMP